MNKKMLCLVAAACALTMQAQCLLPTSVQQYLEERRISNCTGATRGLWTVEPRFVEPQMQDGQEMIDAFIAVDNDAVVKQLQVNGVEVNAVFDGFVTARIPTDLLTTVSAMPGVNDVEISQRLYLSTDSTRNVTHTTQVLDGVNNALPMSYDGTGVIFGIVDVGFDFNHMAFQDGEGRSRVVRVYNTTNRTGHPAYYNGTTRLPGSVFMGDEIRSLTTDNRSSTHGTHTAGIGAGTHVNGYGGMAPNADIVMCAVSVLDGSMSAVEVANCLRYIVSYADSVGKPCVMSISVSTPNGQHDGNDYLSKVVNQITGPGRIFVISAGNNAGRKSYAHKKASRANPMNLMLKCTNSLGGDSTYYYGGMLSDIWMRTPYTNIYYKIHVLDVTTGKIVWESSEQSSRSLIDASELAGYYDCYQPGDTAGYIRSTITYVSDGKKYHLEVSVHNLITHAYTLTNGVKKSRYAIGVTVYPRTANAIDIDAWACISTTRFGTYTATVTPMMGEPQKNFYTFPSDSCSIGTYAVGDSTISAGSFVARNKFYSLNRNRTIVDNSVTVGNIASFSSYQAAGCGPTGKALPTISAPGYYVVSAGSRYNSYARNTEYTVMNVDGHYWCVMSGTSMAAPTVAGIIALWLQANPRLSVSEAMDILSETAIRDKYTMGNSAVRFGPNGKIDAYAGIQAVLKRLGVRMGDVNGDGKVDIVDVVMFIEYLLHGQLDGFLDTLADMDGNGSTDITDLAALIDKVIQSGDKLSDTQPVRA